MDKSNENKKIFLGLPGGTARNRLVKSLLFQFAKELKRTICFKCSKEIEDIKEFTIEHKEPWLFRDPKLFWDLTNIAFSHTKCNKRRMNRQKFCHLGHEKSNRPNGKWVCKICAVRIQINYIKRKKLNIILPSSPTN